MNPLIGPAPFKRRWYGDDDRRSPSSIWAERGTAADIAAALLSIPGVTSVGLADHTDDRRVERFMVDIVIRFAPLSMTNGALAESDWDLIQTTVEAALFNHMPAGIGHRVTYELV